MLIDTHCHLNLLTSKEFDVLLPENFKETLIPIIQAAADKDVQIIINVGTNVIESTNCIEIAQTFNNCFASIGIHPTDTNVMEKNDSEKIAALLDHKTENKIVAIGEVGLDYYHDHDKKKQYSIFEFHIKLALEHKIPLIIHTRNAKDEVLTILDHFKCSELTGVIHCFSEDVKFAQKALDLKFFLGIGGTLTYPKNEQLRDIFSSVELEHIVLETDAPFLPPQAIRGKQNTPEQINTIASFLADLRKVPYQKIAEETTKNAKKLFNI
jgi:TatD DNase family protein